MAAYYNEFDPYAAQWLRNLAAAGHIAPGEVDERSICDVDSADLADFTQCHFFAGIGVWSHALRLAGWPDDRPVWTGSCPCQPFSAAGKRGGFDDERHLWPELFRLVRERRPPVVFGEQVASKDGLEWLDTVQADLERAGYASAAADLCAAGVGAPHIRQRLYWVADAQRGAAERHRHEMGSSAGGVQSSAQQQWVWDDAGHGVNAIGLDNNNNKGLEGHGWRHRAEIGHGQGSVRPVTEAGEPCGVADADCQRPVWQHALLQRQEPGRQQQDCAEVAWGGEADGLADAAVGGRAPSLDARSGDAEVRGGEGNGQPGGGDLRPSPTHGFWGDADWLYCRDGKWRPVEPGTFPLAHGAAARVGRLRAYGNAIVPQVAQAFIEAFMECRP